MYSEALRLPRGTPCGHVIHPIQSDRFPEGSLLRDFVPAPSSGRQRAWPDSAQQIRSNSRVSLTVPSLRESSSASGGRARGPRGTGTAAASNDGRAFTCKLVEAFGHVIHLVQPECFPRREFPGTPSLATLFLNHLYRSGDVFHLRRTSERTRGTGAAAASNDRRAYTCKLVEAFGHVIHLVQPECFPDRNNPWDGVPGNPAPESPLPFGRCLPPQEDGLGWTGAWARQRPRTMDERTRASSWKRSDT
jgi:hypothetical protein